jgi:hypothetical protein
LAALQERARELERKTRERRRVAKKEWWFKHHGPSRFNSNGEMNNWIVAQYQSGTSAHEIGEGIGMSHSAVCGRLRDKGVDLPPRGRGRGSRRGREYHLRKVDIEDVAQFDAEVCQLYDAGTSMTRISKLFGVFGVGGSLGADEGWTQDTVAL